MDASALRPPAFALLQQGLAAALTRNKGLQLDLVLLAPESPPSTVLVKSPSQLRTALGKLSAAAADGSPVSIEELASFIESGFSAGREWRRMVYAGSDLIVPQDLREYALGFLARVLSERRIRLCHWLSIDGAEPAWGPALAATGGSVSVMGPDVPLDTSGANWLEFDPPGFAPGAGFRVAPIELRSADGRSWRFPWIWQASGTKLPGFAEYLESQELRARVQGASPEAAAALARLLEVNPYDVEALGMAAERAERAGDFAAAAERVSRILEIQPLDGALWSRRGHYEWMAGKADDAERHLLRARELQADHPKSAIILGDIRSGKADHRGALTHYLESVRRENTSTDSWLKLAATQKALSRHGEMAQSLEAVLKLKADLWESRTELVDHYLLAGDRESAGRHVEAAAQILPADAALTRRFAEYFERIERPREAMGLWTRAIGLEPKHEPAHYSLARLYAESKEWERALAAGEAGLTADAASGRLRAVSADALLALGRLEDARRFLRSSAQAAPEAVVLERAATIEDRYGKESPRHYKALVADLRARGAAESSWRPLAEHGLRVSVRDQDTEACRWFAGLTNPGFCGPEGPANVSTGVVLVPGGYRALLFIARGPARSSPEAFLADYSRTLMTHLESGDQQRTGPYVDHILEYFRLIADLKAMGRAENGKTVVRLSLAGDRPARLTQRVLSLLGWTARRSSGKFVVEPATRGRRTRGQDLASALLIDMIEMQERLQEGGEFVVEIADEPVPVFPEERAWQEQFYRGSRRHGGFAEAMVRNPAMASLYAALSNMDPESAATLVRSIGMRRLAERYGSLLALYSSGIQISGSRVAVPGGDRAAPIWASLVRADPKDIPRFIRELLDRDDGRLMRFYFMLSKLDYGRQRFFTANLSRAARFYEVFRESMQVEGRIARNFGASSIHDLFRELPIDAEGRILFPGGPEVWMVARNRSSSVASTERRLRRLSRVTTPEVEDEILLRLVGSEYRTASLRIGAWQNFLAVIRLEAARREPLDEASALLLAESFGANEGLFAYLARFSAFERDHYREAFLLAEKLRGLDAVRASMAAGQFHAGLQFLAMAEHSGGIQPRQAAELFLGLCRAMNRAASPGGYARASLDFLHAFLGAAGVEPTGSAFRDVLLPSLADAEIPGDYGGRTVSPGTARRRDYERVLELQKIPPLDGLFRIREALAALSSGKGDPRPAVNALLEGSKGLQHLELPRKTRLDRFHADLLKSDSASRVAGLNRQLQRESAKKKVNAKRLQKLAGDYWEAIAFQTCIALSGQIYAAYLSPEDLLVAEDPYFVRKHKFVWFGGSAREVFPRGALQVSSDAGGSHVTGGFDGMAAVAGDVAAASLRNVDSVSAAAASALIGSVRITDWSRVTSDSTRFVALQVRAGRDLLVLAAANEPLFDAVAEAAYGTVSLNRRARLLRALRSRDWPAVWSSLSPTDLYFLAGRLRGHEALKGVNTPAIAGWRELPKQTGASAGVQALGPALRLLRGYGGPALVDLAPYEDAAAEKFPADLAERVAEFKMHLACLLVEEALPAAALPAIAEAAAREVAQELQMSNTGDWQAVLDAYGAFDAARLKEAATAP